MSKLIEFAVTEADLGPERDLIPPGPKRFELPWGDEIDCPDASGMWLILQDANGFLFTSQVGGFACLHPEYRGKLFSSTALDKALAEMEDYIYEKFSGYCVPKSHFFHEEGSGRCLGAENADDIDAIFEKHGLGSIKIDRSKLEQSAEAWVFGLWDGKPCVLATHNSD